MLCAHPGHADGENYSLWPRRPETLTEARRLMDKGQDADAVKMLQPLVSEGGVVGREAKDLIGHLRIRQVLDPNGPDVKKYTVRRGDAWILMSKRLKCSQAMLIHLNGLMDVPLLQVGASFKYRPLDFHLVINVPEKEISLYEGGNFLKSYPIQAIKDTGKKNIETKIKEERSSRTIYEKKYASSDKSLILDAGGYVIEPKTEPLRSPGFYLNRQDCNELSLLTRQGNKVSIIREKGES